MRSGEFPEEMYVILRRYNKALWIVKAEEFPASTQRVQQNNKELISDGERTDSKYNRQKNKLVQRPPAEGKSRAAWKIQQVSSGANNTGRSWKEAGARNTTQLRTVLSILKA